MKRYETRRQGRDETRRCETRRGETRRSDERSGEQAGGGLGRPPILNQTVREALPWRHLLTYIEAILRVYNRYGRRDNKYKARIKILVDDMGIESFGET